MEITSVKLQNSGFKGLDVTYLKEEEKEGRPKINKITSRPRHPIHLGLEVPFKDLRFHLLQICEIINDDMSKTDIDALLSECEITQVDIDPGYFVIKGVKNCFSEKSFGLKTPKVEAADDYKHYDTVMKIIEKIEEETKHYLEGSVKVTDEEVVERWIGAGKEKEFDINSFNNLPEEERKKVCQDILEKSFGATVLMPEDVEIDMDEDSQSFVIDPQAETIKLPA